MSLAMMSLTGCKSAPPVIDPGIVYVPQNVYVAVPTSLTAPLPYPNALPAQFTVRDVIEQAFAVYDALDQCNADRAAVLTLTTPK